MPAGISTLINGHRWDFASVTLRVNVPTPTILTLVASINYEDALTPTALRGTSAMKLGRTRGQYEANGSMSIYAEEFRVLMRALAAMPPAGGGFMEKSFEIGISYGEEFSVPANDELQGVRIVRVNNQNQQGGDPLYIDVDLDIMSVLRDGLPSVVDKGVLAPP
jgi:hypothetical protein